MLLKLATCHKCQSKTNAKVKIFENKYIAICSCGNKGLDRKNSIFSAVMSWNSGYQFCDKK